MLSTSLKTTKLDISKTKLNQDLSTDEPLLVKRASAGDYPLRNMALRFKRATAAAQGSRKPDPTRTNGQERENTREQASLKDSKDSRVPNLTIAPDALIAVCLRPGALPVKGVSSTTTPSRVTNVAKKARMQFLGNGTTPVRKKEKSEREQLQLNICTPASRSSSLPFKPKAFNQDPRSFIYGGKQKREKHRDHDMQHTGVPQLSTLQKILQGMRGHPADELTRSAAAPPSGQRKSESSDMPSLMLTDIIVAETIHPQKRTEESP